MANFKEIIVKPLKLQMLVEFPELKDDEVFANQIDIDFVSNQLFDEWKKLGNMSKKIEILGSYTGIQKADGTPYFHIDYLIDNVLKLSAEEKEENKRYWIRDSAGGGSSDAAPAEGGGDAGGDAGGGDVGGEAGAQATPEAPAAEAPAETPAPDAGGEAGGGEFEF
jgi:hypothetical protein